MINYRYHYDYITAYYDDFFLFIKCTTGILRALNILIPMKVVEYTEFNTGVDGGNFVIYVEATHAFSALTYTKNSSDIIEKPFHTTLKPRQGQQKRGDWTGVKTEETGSWRRATRNKRDLGSRSKASEKQVQDRRWRQEGCKLVYPGGPRPEQE